MCLKIKLEIMFLLFIEVATPLTNFSHSPPSIRCIFIYLCISLCLSIIRKAHFNNYYVVDILNLIFLFMYVFQFRQGRKAYGN